MDIVLVFLLALIPQTIQVRVTGLAVCQPEMTWHTETIDFKEYTKYVLAAEWGYMWDTDSLRAGAIAVKQFAMAEIASKGYVYDCHYDQVMGHLRFETIDAAVDATWDYVLLNDGKIVKTYYNAWMGGCLERGEANCMGQWDSKADAAIGQSWEIIAMKHYEGYIVGFEFGKPLIE